MTEQEKEKDILAFREKVYADLTDICQKMNEIIELDETYSKKYYQYDSGAFFNEFLPTDKNYPFEKSFDDQLYALQNWREKVGELLKVKTSKKETTMSYDFSDGFYMNPTFLENDLKRMPDVADKSEEMDEAIQEEETERE